jgi:uncharacterized protein YdeI (YjbR/CyaY-like superfamily)
MAVDTVVRAKDRAAWRRWLERHHASSPSVWLVIHKKGHPTGGLFYEDAVQEALCFGWIDSTANALDEHNYKLWMAPRKRRSGWSAVNKRRIERLLADGQIAPAGLAAIDAAKRDGSWAALDSSHSLTVPRDLTKAFKRYPGAARHFQAFPPSARRVILQWIDAAKRPETRAKRIDETAQLAQENIRANQWRPKS